MDSSDGEVEEQINDRLSFSHFVGLGMEDSAPDSTTVCRFRNILIEKNFLWYGAGRNQQAAPEYRGGVVRRGAIVDASITDTPRRPRGRKEYEAVTGWEEEDGRKA